MTTENKTLLRRPASEWSLTSNEQGMEEQVTPLWGEHTVGREDCEILLSDPHSSRRHAKLIVSKDGLLVEDLKSANGTFVNEEKIETTTLKDGDIVRFDMQEFTVIGPNPDAGKTMLRSEDVPEKVVKKTPRKKVSAKKTPAPKSPSVQDLAAESQNNEELTRVQKPVENIDLTQQATRRVQTNDLQKILSEKERKQAEPNFEPTAESSRLVFMTGESIGKVIGLSSAVMTVGRSGADIPLDEPSVSMKHAQIIMQENKWKVVDLMSANGVRINGKKVQSSFLNSGDVLRFGRVELRFTIAQASKSPHESKTDEQNVVNDNHNSDSKASNWAYIAISFTIIFAIAIVFILLTSN